MRFLYCLSHALRHPRIAWLGAREFRLAWTAHLDNEDEAEAYDCGRELAHLFTLRRFEDWRDSGCVCDGEGGCSCPCH